jgi:hypothetical protein
MRVYKSIGSTLIAKQNVYSNFSFVQFNWALAFSTIKAYQKSPYI